ncbi:MAG: cytochrome C [Oceanospirillaceae bacterium]|nr:cytochrome C [Oceanospirillaceae bacterium]
MKHPALTTLALLGLACLGSVVQAAPDDIDRGRYLVSIGGCNDCHTPGYAQVGDRIPERDRLTGDTIGFAGPWGVSYPQNLRLGATAADEETWLARVRAGGLPPMPWSALQAMTGQDLRAVYRYLRSLGAAGSAAPAALAPGQAIATPYISFEPLPPVTDGAP